jgi:GABA permease
MAHGSEDQLGKGLRQRHLAMIAIGGVIGAGLFVGSGAVIAEVGPAAFLTYALTGVLIIMVMRMLGPPRILRLARSLITPASRSAAGPASRSAGSIGTSG